MKKKVINIDGAKRPMRPDGTPVAPISQAVEAGGFVFVSGLLPLDMSTGEIVSGDIQVQTRQCLENVKSVLEAAETTLENVVKTTVYCTNSGHFDKVNDIYREYFPVDPPARTFVTVGSWPMAFDIEIECVAIK